MIEAGPPASDRKDFWQPHTHGEAPPGVGMFALKIFLVSLCVPFIVCLIGYFHMRNNVAWQPRELPSLLWLSTGLIILTSFGVEGARQSVRKDHYKRLRGYCVLVLALGGLFLVCQTIAWHGLVSHHLPSITEEQDLSLRVFVATFFMLTGLHAIHVVGGLVLQSVITVRVYRRRYWSLYYPGLSYSAFYWHFLAGAWLLVFTTLLLGS